MGVKAMWQLLFTARARKDLLSLEKPVAERIISKLEQASADPQKAFSKLSGFQYYKLRVGDYRVIAFLDFSMKVVEVRRIGHRKNIYGKI
ncbi:MAG TPA: type II toxin-antitoxin system RelE/ParE family toxin [archaeon]|nr:type II toxin-antitoxin system RelE/ParE family toxin [archaeon]